MTSIVKDRICEQKDRAGGHMRGEQDGGSWLEQKTEDLEDTESSGYLARLYHGKDGKATGAAQKVFLKCHPYHYSAPKSLRLSFPPWGFELTFWNPYFHDLLGHYWFTAKYCFIPVTTIRKGKSVWMLEVDVPGWRKNVKRK